MFIIKVPEVKKNVKIIVKTVVILQQNCDCYALSNISMHYRSFTEQMWSGDSGQPALVSGDHACSMGVETR